MAACKLSMAVVARRENSRRQPRVAAATDRCGNQLPASATHYKQADIPATQGTQPECMKFLSPGLALQPVLAGTRLIVENTRRSGYYE